MHLEAFAAPFTAGPSRIGFVTSRSGESADSGERGEREERKSDDCGRGRRGRGRDRVEFVVLRRFCSRCPTMLSNMEKAYGESNDNAKQSQAIQLIRSWWWCQDVPDVRPKLSWHSWLFIPKFSSKLSPQKILQEPSNFPTSTALSIPPPPITRKVRPSLLGRGRTQGLRAWAVAWNEGIIHCIMTVVYISAEMFRAF